MEKWSRRPRERPATQKSSRLFVHPRQQPIRSVLRVKSVSINEFHYVYYLICITCLKVVDRRNLAAIHFNYAVADGYPNYFCLTIRSNLRCAPVVAHDHPDRSCEVQGTRSSNKGLRCLRRLRGREVSPGGREGQRGRCRDCYGRRLWGRRLSWWWGWCRRSGRLGRRLLWRHERRDRGRGVPSGRRNSAQGVGHMVRVTARK